ncbi:Uncharacterised protein [Vibrio cholerae]|nr:Uncharacterised protein [Vibrio cholerae]CSB96356.1 Uncharacterised protein [Vibrio cholerae]CSC02603.1 Uncharacterised protein [Vibrio cholerae]CSC30677.1 Uncharacterised protein [Vibrio cholerae]
MQVNFTLHFTTLTTFLTKTFQCPNSSFITSSSCFNTLTDPNLFLSELFIKLGILQLFNPQHLFFFSKIIFIISWERAELTAIEIHNAGCHRLNKSTVMGNENDRTSEIFQKTF